MVSPVRVFLDSSDYSAFSDQSLLSESESLRKAYDCLAYLVDQKEVVCYFSGLILGEMSPIKPIYTSAAMRRADVVVRLCGKNALVSHDRLFRNELSLAHGLPPYIDSPYSDSGEWYPSGILDLLPTTAKEQVDALRRALRRTPMNRRMRRAAERQLVERGKLSMPFKELLAQHAQSRPLTDVLQQFPMRPEDARILALYAVGLASPETASSAIASSLSDPRWMMAWFAQHHDTLSPFINWVRRPAETAYRAFQRLIEQAMLLHDVDLNASANQAGEFFSAKNWQRCEDELLPKVANQLSSEFLENFNSPLTTAQINSRCPGLTVSIRSLLSAWRASTGPTPRKSKPSDFTDVLHAAYAPYVDLFRADSFMAPHIQKSVAHFSSTRIVQKLALLPEALSCALGARRSNSRV